ncbi:MAG: MFS transporter [Deltaproteobacteria bacterium]|nr:MFS transporter [Deltaproteobacteria bacterium]
MPPAPETSAAPEPAPPFPRTFWTANTTELFERAAYYAMASFVVIYLGRLGLGKYWPSTLNGLLWTLVYFLPILSGTIADVVGFRRSLLVAFVLLAIGYFFMGYPVWLGGATLLPQAGMEITATAREVAPVLLALLLIGMGGSIIKPCISGTVQKTAAARATLGFAIFYMVINIGSLTGRGTAYLVRTRTSISAIFAVAAVCCVIAFFVVLLFYADPDQAAAPTGAPAKPKRRVGRILLDMFLVLGNLRFALFLLVSSGFFFLYAQVYNVLPLYLEKVVQKEPPVDIYTMANPFVIVFFQLLITKLFGKMRPIRSMVVGAVIIAVAFLLNVVPLFMGGGVRVPLWELIPVGALFVVLTVALVAFGELFTSARTYEYIGALAPKGQEGLFLGYANLPMAIGSLVGGPVGAAIFNEVMCKGAVPLESGLLQLKPGSATAGWCILMGIGVASAASMWVYNWWLERQEAREAMAS